MPPEAPKELRNLAILAHVDAGKTTVSERLLYFSDTIPGLGEVDEGLATMDYLEEEKKRGITIEAGIASYGWKNCDVTFVDTPGHVDFGVEVDFALQAVEGVVLVLSGVSGIESQSLEAWEKIKANGNRALIFINKLDLPAADHGKVMDQIQLLFGARSLALTLPIRSGDAIVGVVDVLNGLALYRPADNPRRLVKGDIPEALRGGYAEARKALVDAASDFDDALLEACLAGAEPRPEALVPGLRAAMASGRYLGTYLGSALRNVGVRQLMNGINHFLPPPRIGPELAARKGFVIKIRFYQGVGKIHLAKLFAPVRAGELGGARLYRVFAESLEEIPEAEAGRIVAIRSDRPYRIGEGLDQEAGAPPAFARHYQPLLQSRIELVRADDFDHVERVLRQLAEAEPSIAISPDPATGGWLIRTVGELQLEVFCRRLKKDYGCDIQVGAPRVRYLERLKRPQTALENRLRAQDVEIRLVLDAAGEREGEENRLFLPDAGLSEQAGAALRGAFGLFCEEGVCGFGSIAGLRVRIADLECRPDQPPLPLLVKAFVDCLQLRLTPEFFEVFEPIMRLEIIIPDEFCGPVLADLAAKGGIIRKLDSDGYNSIILLEIPLEKTFGYTTLLRSLSKGLGVFVLTFEKYGLKKAD